MSGLKCILIVLALLIPMGLTSHANIDTAVHSGIRLNHAQRTLADQIISVFENNNPVLQYSYASTLGDGRGITAGRAGFTSATGDMLLVINRYTEQVPENALATFVPRLTTLAEHWSGSTSGLGGLTDAWRVAAEDPVFRQVQDTVVDTMYYQRAENYAQRLGIQLPLTLLLLYDAVVQHGFGPDPDGLPEMIRRTNQSLNGAPGDGVDEILWMRQFLDIRLGVLNNASNRNTRIVWRESTGRVDALTKLLDDGHTNLNLPVTINPWGTAHALIPRE